MKINNVLIITQSKQDRNYIEAITKLDNAGFAYSVINLQLDGKVTNFMLKMVY